MENKYLIYESAITAPIEQPKRNGNIVEFITVLQEADRKNRNGRIYPKEVIDAALHSPLVQEHLRHKTLVGECGHPFSQDLARQTNVDMRNAAFRVDEFWWEGNLLKGRCRTLDTAVGRDMAGMIMDGCELSFSMRGQGNVIRDPARDALVVQPPLMLICWDWVWTPSHDAAYMEKICEETKESFFNRTASMSLMESMNLYENGSLTEIGESKKEEKPFIDYYATYGRTFKTLNETYQYNPDDQVKEINDKYVILENDTSVMKVARNDYLLKSMRKAVSESCCGIAALDCPRSTEPLTDKETSAPSVDSAEVLQTLSSDVDVKPTEEYENPVESEVKKELGDEAKNVSASAKLSEESSVDEVEGTKLPDGTTESKPEEGNPEVKTDDVIETVDSDKDVEGHENKELQEEFLKYYKLIAEETGLTEAIDIIRLGTQYSEFMSEECANLFAEYAKRGE